MTQNPILRARIDEGGRVVWQGYEGKRWETIKGFLRNQDVEITISKRRKKATGKQRRYYFAVIVAAFAEEMGCTKDEAHEALRWHFLKTHEDGPLPTVRSTEELTTAQRENYHEQCRQLCAEMFGRYVPDPNEVAQ